MEGYDAGTHWDRYAAMYDRSMSVADELLDTQGAVSFLAELAGDGPVLELGIGTGRLALPLARRGLKVQGIDASEAMIELLRDKPGGAELEVTKGDFADVDVEGRFPLVFVAYTTLFNLTTQEDQVRCFANVAEHLADDGVFVVEAAVPSTERFDGNQYLAVSRIEADRVILEAVRYDPAQQREDSQMILLGKGSVELYPISIRYVWPAELDLMARLAGLGLSQRWADWRRTPFCSTSQNHVSVYARQ